MVTDSYMLSNFFKQLQLTDLLTTMVPNRLYNLIIFITFFLITTSFVYAQDRSQLMKAAFLSKFAQLSNWPKTDLLDQDKFVITVIGDDPIFPILKKIYKTKQVNNYPVQITQTLTVCDIGNPHILYVTKSMESHLNNILDKISNKPIMTVSDTDGFGQKGILFNFYITNKGTLHFELNTRIMKKSSLKINLLLVEIAKIIH